MAIFFQESSLKLDPSGCAVHKKCTDFGIGQVRVKVWEKAFNIDRIKLLTDVHYSVQTSVRVLAHYKAKYSKRELNWFTRYHSGITEYRAEYMKRLNAAFAKINTHLEFEESRKVAALP